MVDVWIFYEGGFVSAVKKDDRKSTLVVRARDFKSLEPLAEYCGLKPQKAIKVGGGSDYPYRLEVEQKDFASWAFDVAQSVDYRNFKDRVTGPRGRGKAWSAPLMSVWTAMLAVTPERARRRQQREDERFWARYGSSWRQTTPEVVEGVSEAYDEEWGDGIRDLNSMPLHSLTEDEWAQLMQEEPRGGF